MEVSPAKGQGERRLRHGDMRRKSRFGHGAACIGARDRQLLRLEAAHVQIRAAEGKQASPRLPLINNPATALSTQKTPWCGSLWSTAQRQASKGRPGRQGCGGHQSGTRKVFSMGTLQENSLLTDAVPTAVGCHRSRETLLINAHRPQHSKNSCRYCERDFCKFP